MKKLLHKKSAWDKTALSARLLNSVKVSYASMWTRAEESRPPGYFTPPHFPLALPGSPPTSPSLHRLLFIERPVIELWVSGGRKRRWKDCHKGGGRGGGILQPPLGSAQWGLTPLKKQFSDETTATGKGSCCNCTHPSTCACRDLF